MNVDRTIPILVARAYGIPSSALRPVAAPRPADPPVRSPETGNLHDLVAARVPGRVEFTQGGPPTASSAALPLYTRAADRVEAAVAVQIGRTIDVRG